MRRLSTLLMIICCLTLPAPLLAATPAVTARLLVSNPAPYLGEEIDLLLEVTYIGHPGGRTSFSWPRLDHFVAADLTATRSRQSRDQKNRLVETIIRRIKPLTPGVFQLRDATVMIGDQRLILPPITLRVRPLPTTGKPEAFSNNIGSYRLQLAAEGTGPRVVSLHIYDSNQISPAPVAIPFRESGRQLIPATTETRTAVGGGREHIFRYFYTADEGEKGLLHFSLPVFDPRQNMYLELTTGPDENPASLSIIIVIIAVASLCAGGWGLYRRRRHPRTIAGCLQKFCRRPITGLSREKLLDILQHHLTGAELDALNCYWQYEDEARFNQHRRPEDTGIKPDSLALRRVLWKAIDKQQHIT